MRKRNILLILTVFSLMLGGCRYDFIVPEEVPVVDQDEPVSFSTQIAPIFTTQKCNDCHNNQSPKLTSDVAYAQIVPAYVNTANPSSSKIYSIPNSGAHYAKITAAQGALILAWITEGAKNN